MSDDKSPLEICDCCGQPREVYRIADLLLTNSFRGLPRGSGLRNLAEHAIAMITKDRESEGDLRDTLATFRAFDNEIKQEQVQG